MSESDHSQPTLVFWIIGVVALLWNLLGMWAYYSNVTATPEMLAALYNEAQVAMIQATPMWATSATAIAVTAGVVASVLLLLRNKLSVPLFVVSLLALIVQDVHIFGMTDSVKAFGMQPVYIQGVVLVVAALLTWYARKQARLGLIR